MGVLDLTFGNEYDIPSENSYWEDGAMLARFHDGHSIYLYCITSIADSNNIKAGIIKYPLKLYENAPVANRICEDTYIADRVVLRFAVKLDDVIYYDSFSMTSKLIKDKFNISIEEYKSKCDYTRTLNKQKGVIEYTILNSKPIINVQEV